MRVCHLAWTSVATLGILLGPHVALADVTPHPLFSDGAVLQRDRPVPVWGTAADGEKVTVSIQGQQRSATTEDGKWIVWLDKLEAGGPVDLTIQGNNTVTVKNVLIGEVWIASGQSNMQWPVAQSAQAEQVIASSANPYLRLFTVPRAAADEPQTTVGATWQECGPSTVPQFSAVAYFFGRHLQQKLNVPVGLINTSFGGTPAEAWTSHEKLAGIDELRTLLDQQTKAIEEFPAQQEAYQAKLAAWEKAAEEAKARNEDPPPKPQPPVDPKTNPRRPVGLYNAMIHPLLPYAIRGAIWYQGESNAGQAWQYRTLFPAMIADWRTRWNQGDFPFLFVQLAPFMKIVAEPGDSAWAELRDAQRFTAHSVPNSAMAVITDVGDENDIHPQQKQPVGDRLALAALALAYGQQLEYSGPDFRKQTIDGAKITLEFDHVGGGLTGRDAQGNPTAMLTGFTVAGEDRVFHPAEATIEGDRVVVHSPQVAQPVAVRYGWANYPLGNLWNKDGLPATPFRTDEFPLTTARQ